MSGKREWMSSLCTDMEQPTEILLMKQQSAEQSV